VSRTLTCRIPLLCRISPGKSILRLTLAGFLFSGFLSLQAQQSLTDEEVIQRTEFIRQSLEAGKPAAQLWWNGWLYGYSAATVVQGGIFLKSDVLKTRQDMALGAATTLIGAAGQLVAPMTPAKAPARLALLPGDTPEERRLKLEEAEKLLAASARREADGRGWKFQLASGAVNLGAGLVTWIGFDRSIWAGLGNFALNTAICEAQIYTQPTRAMRDYKTYLETYSSGMTSVYQRPPLQWTVRAIPGGMALKVTF
jgi:hypothetical protein